MSACVKGVEALFGKRPAAVDNPVAHLKIDCVERPAPAAPVRRRAAERTGSGTRRAEYAGSPGCALVHLLRSVARLHRSALEQDDAQPTTGKFLRDGQACRTAADDADISMNRGGRQSASARQQSWKTFNATAWRGRRRPLRQSATRVHTSSGVSRSMQVTLSGRFCR